MLDFQHLLTKKEPVVQKIYGKELTQAEIELYIQREDLFHPELSGNKWRKLKYNLLEAKEDTYTRLLSFGGAFSNHIHALAASGKHLGFETIGVIRGEASSRSNPTLRFAEQCGMQLYFVSRTDYRRKEETAFMEELEKQFGRFYLIPEGGSNALAVKGCTEIVSKVQPYDVIGLSAGTGATAAGVIASLEGEKEVIAFSALKGDFLKKDIEKFIYDFRQTCPSGRRVSYTNWTLNTDYHFGAYAKFNDELIQFIQDFQKRFDIPLDPIYTGKMMYGIFDLIQKGHFPKGTKILAIHTGGLQGVEGFRERFGVL